MEYHNTIARSLEKRTIRTLEVLKDLNTMLRYYKGNKIYENQGLGPWTTENTKNQHRMNMDKTESATWIDKHKKEAKLTSIEHYISGTWNYYCCYNITSCTNYNTEYGTKYVYNSMPFPIFLYTELQDYRTLLFNSFAKRDH